MSEASPPLPRPKGRAEPRLLLALKRRAGKLKRQVWSLFLAWKDPATPWLAKAVVGVTVAYALSPIDLIPDFIPVLGYLDDLLILPALIALAIRLIPAEVMARSRRRAWEELRAGSRVRSKAGMAAALAFAAAWAALAAWVLSLFL